MDACVLDGPSHRGRMVGEGRVPARIAQVAPGATLGSMRKHGF